jgi:hypothetical protein
MGDQRVRRCYSCPQEAVRSVAARGDDLDPVRDAAPAGSPETASERRVAVGLVLDLPARITAWLWHATRICQALLGARRLGTCRTAGKTDGPFRCWARARTRTEDITTISRSPEHELERPARCRVVEIVAAGYLPAVVARIAATATDRTPDSTTGPGPRSPAPGTTSSETPKSERPELSTRRGSWPLSLPFLANGGEPEQTLGRPSRSGGPPEQSRPRYRPSRGTTRG